MNKQQLAEIVYANFAGTKNQSKEVVELIFNTIKETIISGDMVNIGSFGMFYPQKRNARNGRNPKTGASVKVPTHRIVKFKVAGAFKTAVK